MLLCIFKNTEPSGDVTKMAYSFELKSNSSKKKSDFSVSMLSSSISALNHLPRILASIFDFSELVKSIYDRAIITSENTRNFQQQIEDKIVIMGDRFALGSLINNILENAVKYSPAGAAIQVQLYQQSNKIFFIVADQGVGIPTIERQKIFQKFYRSGNELTRKNKGTGLGLFIVEQVAKNHQAKVLVNNNLPKGTIFEIIFNLEQ